MNNNMNEISKDETIRELYADEMELISGGIGGIAIAACIIGVAAAAVKVAGFVYDWVKH